MIRSKLMPEIKTMNQIKKEYAIEVLEFLNWNQTATSRELGMSAMGFSRFMKDNGIVSQRIKKCNYSAGANHWKHKSKKLQ